MRLSAPAAGLLLWFCLPLGAQGVLQVPGAFATVQGAIDAAANGDTIVVGPGTWSGNLDFQGKAVHVVSAEGAAATFITPGVPGPVVTFQSGEGAASILEGFTIAGGTSSGSVFGSGIRIDGASPTIRGCRLLQNTGQDGGGIHAGNAVGLLIEDCAFESNVVTSKGGGILLEGSSATIRRCTFLNNQATFIGGGIAAVNSSLTLEACTFISNQTSGGGGGIALQGSFGSISTSTFTLNDAAYGGAVFLILTPPVVISSCLIANNHASLFGGGVDCVFSDALLTGCTLADNAADTNSGGLRVVDGNVLVGNAIVYGNTPDQINQVGPGLLQVSHSDVQGGHPGTGNIDADPLFEGAPGADYHLQATSPCIGAGDNSFPELAALDFEGDPRIAGGTVDMGADEFVPVTSTFIDRPLATDLRILTYNVYLNTIFPGVDPVQAARFARILTATQPDVVALQEVYFSAAATAALFDTILPLPGGATWQAFKVIDTVLVSRYPLSMQASSPVPAGADMMAMALVDLPDAVFPTDLYVIANHYVVNTGPATNVLQQQNSDAIINWIRDIKTPGGLIDLPAGTAIAVVGDLNIQGSLQPLQTLLSGDIMDESTYGPDMRPDWDGTVNTDAAPPHNTDQPFHYTWRDDLTPDPPSRIDVITYSDSILEASRRMVLNTTLMSTAQLAATGLQPFDVTIDNVGQSFDHLPVIVDLRPAPAPFPGTQDDFLLQSLVNAQGNPFAAFKDATAGDLLTVTMSSPAGTLVGGAPVLLGQFHAPGVPIQGPLGHQGVIHVDLPGAAFLFGLTPGPFGPPLLPLQGISLSFAVPPGLGGQALRLQSLLLTPLVPNGFYAASDAHEILFN